MIDSQTFNQAFFNQTAPPQFAPTYLFSGKSTFLALESAQLLTDSAKHNGFSERQIHYLNNKTASLRPIVDELNSLGLFSNKTIHELRFETDKPSQKLGEQLLEVARHRTENLVIIQATGLHYQCEKTKWFTELKQLATHVVAKPVTYRELPQWITQRAKQRNVTLESEALKRIMRYSEGNLLWTSQILMQLGNSDYPQPITVERVESMLTDLSVFQADDLVQAILAKNTHAIHIVQKLAQENEPLPLITAFLQKEIGDVLAIMRSGLPFEQACRTFRIWQNKQALYRSALKHYQIEQLLHARHQLAKLDRINKGAEVGADWTLLTQIVSELVLPA